MDFVFGVVGIWAMVGAYHHLDRVLDRSEREAPWFEFVGLLCSVAGASALVALALSGGC